MEVLAYGFTIEDLVFFFPTHWTYLGGCLTNKTTELMDLEWILEGMIEWDQPGELFMLLNQASETKMGDLIFLWPFSVEIRALSSFSHLFLLERKHYPAKNTDRL